MSSIDSMQKWFQYLPSCLDKRADCATESGTQWVWYTTSSGSTNFVLWGSSTFSINLLNAQCSRSLAQLDSLSCPPDSHMGLTTLYIQLIEESITHACYKQRHFTCLGGIQLVCNALGVPCKVMRWCWYQVEHNVPTIKQGSLLMTYLHVQFLTAACVGTRLCACTVWMESGIISEDNCPQALARGMSIRFGSHLGVWSACCRWSMPCTHQERCLSVERCVGARGNRYQLNPNKLGDNNMSNGLKHCNSSLLRLAWCSFHPAIA